MFDKNDLRTKVKSLRRKRLFRKHSTLTKRARIVKDSLINKRKNQTTY